MYLLYYEFKEYSSKIQLMKLLKFYKLGREAGGRRLEVTIRLLFSILNQQITCLFFHFVNKSQLKYFKLLVLPSSSFHPF
ncbi:hypothetical protein DBR39_21455 [Chryseobacterium sp. KBW03]|nr:hypothetical protein DBR39_21455 [Chryseobacterium sp. KBW03]